MSTIPYRSPQLTHKSDLGRRYLLVFGIVLIVLGGLSACAALALAYAALRGGNYMPPALATLPPPIDPITFSFQLSLLLGVLATLFISTGIGSIRLRCWTRPIVISFAGIFIFGIVVALLQLSVHAIAQQYTGPSPPPLTLGNRVSVPAAAPDVMQDVFICVLVIGAIGFPLIFLFAYHSRAVQLALEESDPGIAWTSRVPIPVLALAIALTWTGFLALIQLIPSPVPYFLDDEGGMFGYLFSILFALFLAASASAVYRKHPAGPWLAIISVFIVGASMMLAASAGVNQQSQLPPPGARWPAVNQQSQLPPPGARWPAGNTADLQSIAISAFLASLAYVIPALGYILYARGKMRKD